MSDLEKVASAIHRAIGFAGDYGQSPFSKEQCAAAARAAVEALREPSEGMVAAAHASMVRENCGYEYSVTLGHRAMIDHILKEG